MPCARPLPVCRSLLSGERGGRGEISAVASEREGGQWARASGCVHVGDGVRERECDRVRCEGEDEVGHSLELLGKGAHELVHTTSLATLPTVAHAPSYTSHQLPHTHRRTHTPASQPAL